MMNGCEEDVVKLPMGMFVPFRQNTTTTHNNDGIKVIVGFVLPEDELAQTMRISALGRSADGSVRIGAIFDALITRRDSENPDYSVDQTGRSIFTNDDDDFEFDLVENGDAGVNLTARDESGDAGEITWTYQLWVIDEIKLQ